MGAGTGKGSGTTSGIQRRQCNIYGKGIGTGHHSTMGTGNGTMICLRVMTAVWLTLTGERWQSSRQNNYEH